MTLVFSTGLFAQNLVVTLTNSTTETFPISNIQSIKFGTSSMILNELDGTITTWSIDDIDHYAFHQTTGLNEQLILENSHLSIYPNPASNLVNIAFSSAHSSQISIDIMDASGKIIDQVFDGKHQDGHVYQWNNSVRNGMYFIRIFTETKVITKPVVIQ
jgi:hypothetical protein